MATQIRGTRAQNRDKVVRIFNKNVKGKVSDISSYNVAHDGKDGHWLEKQMGIKHNSSNEPDLLGFEMKNFTKGKTTFGDWSPSTAIFKGKNKLMIRDLFLQTFGAPNVNKENRHSWSGKPCPKIEKYNTFGQILKVDKRNNIHAIYSHSKDTRKNKKRLVPKEFQKDNLILAEWSTESMKKKVEKKFNKFGWFKCMKDKRGIYTTIVFGMPITFETWIAGVKKGYIFFDSGMYATNKRPYANWRANNDYWMKLVSETY